MTQEVTSTPGDLTVVPAVFEHALAVYREMVIHARPDEDLDNLLVYDGHLTQLFRKLRLPTPYYTFIKNKLRDMGCIEQLRRGGGSATSKWVLWKEPTLEEWKGSGVARPRRGNKASMQERQIKDLAERCSRLEGIVQAQGEAIRTLGEEVERFRRVGR